MADDICFNGLPDLDFDTAAHYGIKDQKWGIRNYQYENGSYTPAGRERYRRGNGERRGGYSGNRREPYSQRQEEPKKSLKERFVARAKAEPGIIARNIVKKHIPVFALKDDELKNINERLALEESVLHLSGRLSPRDHRTTTHSVFTGILGAGVHTLDAFSVGAAKAFWNITSKAATSKGKGGDHKSSQEQKHDDSNRKKKDASHDGLDEGINFTGLPDLDENSLKHFGILGMKWGIRRFQNPDGTLTPEGKERYYGKTQSKEYYELLKTTKGDSKELRPVLKDAAMRLRTTARRREYLAELLDTKELELITDKNKLDKILKEMENDPEHEAHRKKLKLTKEQYREIWLDPSETDVIEDIVSFYANKSHVDSEKERKYYKDLLNDFYKECSDYNKQQEKVLREILGEYADDPVEVMIGNRDFFSTTALTKLGYQLNADVSKILLGGTASERLKRLGEPWPELKDLMKKYE